MADEIVETKYVLDVDNYVTNINKAQKETQDLDKDQDKLSENSKISWSKMGIAINQWLEVAKKAKDLFVALVRVAIDFRNAADDQADAIDGVNLQLKNMGIYTENLSDKLITNAKALEANSNYTSTAILEGTKMLLTYNNLGEDVLPSATQAMLDMSAVMKMDLTSSAQTIGKALQDPITGLGLLSKQGFHFTEQQKAMIEQLINANDILGAQKIVLGEVDLAFGGHAKLQKDEIETLSTSWNNFKLVIGNIVKPALDGIATQFASILSNITEILKKGEEAKKIANGKAGEVTTEALKQQIADKRKEIEDYKTQISEKKQSLGKVSDAVDDGIREQIKNLENEITTRVKMINTIGAEISRRDDLSKKQEAANKKAKKEEEEASKIAQEKADRKSQEDKDFEVMLTNTQDLSKQSTDGIIAKEPKSNNELQLGDKEQGAESPAEYRDRKRKQKEEDLDYTIRLNDDIRAREDEALQASLKSQKEAAEENQRIDDRNTKAREKHIKEREKQDKKLKDLNEKMAKSYEDVRDVTVTALADVLLGEQKSLAEYGKILADKLAQRLAYISAEAAVEALWETAQGLAALATTWGVPNTASTNHFASAALAAQTATAAGLGAFAAAGVSRGLGDNSSNNEGSNSINNTETASIQNETKMALEDKSVIYISENDFKKMALYNVDAINEALKSGKSLKVRGGR